MTMHDLFAPSVRIYGSLAASADRATRSFAKDEVIFSEGEPATTHYRVTAGAVRSCKLLGDGRRQIVAFHVIDEIFGLEAGLQHRFSAEAIGEASVFSFPRCGAGQLGEGKLAQDVLASAFSDLERSREHATLLGRKHATERVASFLLDVGERMRNDVFGLPMSRTDIADFLGLTNETVSRTLCGLARSRVIRVANRAITLLNKPALRRLSEGSCDIHTSLFEGSGRRS